MNAPHRFAVLALTAFGLILPVTGNTEALIRTKLLSAAPHVAAMRHGKVQKPQAIAFDWLGNGASSASATKSKAAQKRYRVIYGEGSWICSPAGFGQRSRCYAG